jgi:hypothetical protein
VRKNLCLGGVALLFLVALKAYGSDLEPVLSAIQGTLSWERRWYGGHFGQRCLDRAVAASSKVYVAAKPVNFTVGLLCDSVGPVSESAQSFEAYVEGSGLFFSGVLGLRSRADLSDGEGNPQCTLKEDDLTIRASRIKAAGHSTIFRNGEYERTAPPSPEVERYTKRSILAWARHSGRKEISGIMLGYIAPQDPYLVVRTEPDGAFRLVLAPGPVDLADDNFCGTVFESGRFAGRDNATKGRHISGALFERQSVRIK